ncbi:hypothetical protein C8R47DRAFT_1075306 [Mycena vitilis]|nr:hypothetical protein C8R47DRAFT_1075306 [Mycena vitilis]
MASSSRRLFLDREAFNPYAAARRAIFCANSTRETGARATLLPQPRPHTPLVRRRWPHTNIALLRSELFAQSLALFLPPPRRGFATTKCLPEFLLLKPSAYHSGKRLGSLLLPGYVAQGGPRLASWSTLFEFNDFLFSVIKLIGLSAWYFKLDKFEANALHSALRGFSIRPFAISSQVFAALHSVYRHINIGQRMHSVLQGPHRIKVGSFGLARTEFATHHVPGWLHCRLAVQVGSMHVRMRSVRCPDDTSAPTMQFIASCNAARGLIFPAGQGQRSVNPRKLPLHSFGPQNPRFSIRAIARGSARDDGGCGYEVHDSGRMTRERP